MRIARVAVLVAALVVCAWFVLGIRQAHDLAQATTIVQQKQALTASQSAHAASLLRSAGALNPDRQVDLVRAELDIRGSDSAAAKRILESVLRAEPDNLLGWDLLATISGSDTRTLLLAYKHIAELHHAPRGH